MLTQDEWDRHHNDVMRELYQKKNRALRQVSLPSVRDKIWAEWNDKIMEMINVLRLERNYQMRGHEHGDDDYCPECEGLKEECEYCETEPCYCCNHGDDDLCPECLKDGQYYLAEYCPEDCEYVVCQDCRHWAGGHPEEAYCEDCHDNEITRLKHTCNYCSGAVCEDEDHDHSYD